MRRLFSALTLALTLLLLYPLLPGWAFLLSGVLAGPALLYEPLGYLFLALLGFLLAYYRPSSVYPLLALSFGIIYVESVHLADRKAPLIHYIVLFTSVFLAVPLYYLLLFASSFLPSLNNTAVAGLLLVSVYVLLYAVLKG
ncbi:hypothetical protein [Thermococcus sp.]|uniref:hypothetical protein n=1 Tax=Thermococcus sp. TaxID=35749 RepID=UPI002619AD80|nr:hypothetical protein [Thermococcus sp.]